MSAKLLLKIRAEFRKVADPKRAKDQQAYMKSKMPYHGMRSKLRTEICKKIFSEMKLPTREAWQAEVLDLWRGAKFREERYAAIELASDKRAKAFQTPKTMPMYEEMIVTGAWWDFVDGLAAHHVGGILRDYPGVMKRKMLAWSKSPDMWKRRTSILCQLGFKADTDLKLLYACIEPSLNSKEFFLRKAIGWALRQYAWTDPREVKRYVQKNKDRLSALSQREALKNISSS